MVIVICDCTMQIRILSFLPVFRQISVVQSSPPVIYEDIIHIRSIHSFIAEFARENERDVTGIAPDALAELVAYPWPGNIRELRNCIECMVVLAREKILRKSDIPEAIRNHENPVPPGSAVPAPEPEIETFENSERKLIEKALAECNGNRTQAAKLLGIDRKTLYNKLHLYGIE